MTTSVGSNHTYNQLPMKTAIIVCSVLAFSSFSDLKLGETSTGRTETVRKFHTSATPPRLDALSRAEARLGAVEQLHELKNTSGLTWEELARLFHVSRRSLHHWMNGKTLAADNEQRLGELRAFFELMKGVDPVRTRAILLAPGGDGRTVYSLVASGEIAKAITAIQRASRTIVVARTRRESDAPSPLAYLDHRDMEIASRPQGAKGQRLNLGKAKPKA